MPTLTSPGLAIGSMTWKNVRLCEAPSMSAASATEVAEANGLVLTSTIVPGQVLLVPGCRHVTATAGDDWATVAHRLGVDEHALRTANAWQGDTVRPGMVVFGGRSEASVS